MTKNEEYLVVLIGTVTLTYIPVMTPGLCDTFPESHETLDMRHYLGILDRFLDDFGWKY